MLSIPPTTSRGVGSVKEISMSLESANSELLSPETRAYYCKAMQTLLDENVRFMVGGAYAFTHYTGIVRHTKDFDIFVPREDIEHVLSVLAAAGYQTELTFPHWLGKAYNGEDFVDVIFSAANGIAEVDQIWFDRAVDGEVFDIPVKLIPPEEMIWSKGFIMDRERFDGADVIHLLHARAESFDWLRLLQRFDAHWRVLLSHLILFGFVYPGERTKIPQKVMRILLGRLERELTGEPPNERICQGTLLTRAQYLVDIEQWGYADARLEPRGNMTPEETALWTAAIEDDGDGKH